MTRIHRPSAYRIGEWALAAIAGGLTLLVIATLIGQLRDARRTQALVRDATGREADLSPQPPGPPGPPGQRGETHDRLARSINDRNPFSPPPEGIRLTGILGAIATFSNNQSGAAGDRVGDMKVVEIGPGWVEVQADGESRKMWVFGETSGIGDGSRPGGGPPGMRGPPRWQPPETDTADADSPDTDPSDPDTAPPDVADRPTEETRRGPAMGEAGRGPPPDGAQRPTGRRFRNFQEFRDSRRSRPQR